MLDHHVDCLWSWSRFILLIDYNVVVGEFVLAVGVDVSVKNS